MSPRESIATDDAPGAIGPYSQAIAVDGWVYTSGQIALDPRTGELVGDDAPAQTRQVLSNLVAVLAAAGCTPADVVRTTVFLADMGDFAAVNEVYATVFGGDAPPARACVAVKTLPRGGLVEIDAVARRG